MKICLWFMLLFMNVSALRSQDSTLVTIKTGNRIKDVLTTSEVFLYPQYVVGQVVFRDGTRANAMMNYNSLFDQMLFIDPAGDTLALRDEKMIKLIAFQKDTFYYGEGYLRQAGGSANVRLTERRIWEMADIQKVGSHNRPARTFAVTSYKTITDGFGKTHDLILDEDIVLKKKTYYYLGDVYSHFVAANKKNLLLFFSNRQPQITSYLSQNNVDFHKKDDLEKLIQFMEEK
ncbi:MAG: hypothetical protein EOO10_02800 [Chitinophagaceae bacterium]|nr:MAG: hypothetical protein EOO10_02800 [Chitinophagaceae bacterium]